MGIASDLVGGFGRGAAAGLEFMRQRELQDEAMLESRSQRKEREERFKIEQEDRLREQEYEDEQRNEEKRKRLQAAKDDEEARKQKAFDRRLGKNRAAAKSIQSLRDNAWKVLQSAAKARASAKKSGTLDSKLPDGAFGPGSPSSKKSQQEIDAEKSLKRYDKMLGSLNESFMGLLEVQAKDASGGDDRATPGRYDEDKDVFYQSKLVGADGNENWVRVNEDGEIVDHSEDYDNDAPVIGPDGKHVGLELRNGKVYSYSTAGELFPSQFGLTPEGPANPFEAQATPEKKKAGKSADLATKAKELDAQGGPAHSRFMKDEGYTPEQIRSVLRRADEGDPKAMKAVEQARLASGHVLALRDLADEEAARKAEILRGGFSGATPGLVQEVTDEFAARRNELQEPREGVFGIGRNRGVFAVRNFKRDMDAALGFLPEGKSAVTESLKKELEQRGRSGRSK